MRSFIPIHTKTIYLYTFLVTAAILDFENITIQELQLHMYPNHECCL